MKEKRQEILSSKRRKTKEARLVLVGELLSRGYSYRKIAEEVSLRLDLPKYGKSAAHNDAQSLLREWREQRLDSTEEAVDLMLERNRQHYKEVREEWDKSRRDRTRVNTEKKGVPVGFIKGKDDSKGKAGSEEKDPKVVTVEAKEKKITELGEGDPRYMELMIRLEDQRAKLLGLYVDKTEIHTTGDIDTSKLTKEEKVELLEIARKMEG